MRLNSISAGVVSGVVLFALPLVFLIGAGLLGRGPSKAPQSGSAEYITERADSGILDVPLTPEVSEGRRIEYRERIEALLASPVVDYEGSGDPELRAAEAETEWQYARQWCVAQLRKHVELSRENSTAILMRATEGGDIASGFVVLDALEAVSADDTEEDHRRRRQCAALLLYGFTG